MPIFTKMIAMKNHLYLSFLFLAFVLVSCNTGIQGNGVITMETREVTEFNQLDLSGGYNIFIRQGATTSLDVETDENIQELISCKVVDNKLHVTTETMGINPTELNLFITVRELDLIEASGAIDLITRNQLSGSNLKLDVSGAADLSMNLDVMVLMMELSGGSDVNLKGKANEVNMDLSGATDIDAREMLMNRCSISISGAGSASLQVVEQLDASISGAGSISYLGDPQVNQEVSGAGSIKRIGPATLAPEVPEPETATTDSIPTDSI